MSSSSEHDSCPRCGSAEIATHFERSTTPDGLQWQGRCSVRQFSWSASRPSRPMCRMGQIAVRSIRSSLSWAAWDYAWRCPLGSDALFKLDDPSVARPVQARRLLLSTC